MKGTSFMPGRGSYLHSYAPRRVLFRRRAKSLFYRSLFALVIFGLIWGLAQGEGTSAQLVREGAEYLLTENYNFSSLVDMVKTAWTRRGLEVRVSEPRPADPQLPDLPVTGELVRGFGWQEGEDSWPRFHEGIELRAPSGALVRAVLPGKVIRVAERQDLGKIIMIEHEGKAVSLYGRLGKIGVRRGQTVAQGQVIGTVKDTFFHFELRQGKQLVDPILRLQHPQE